MCIAILMLRGWTATLGRTSWTIQEVCVNRLLVIGGLFVLAGLCEIGGGYLVWGWMREHKPLLWALLGALVLAGLRCGGRPATHLRVRAGLRRLRRHLHRALARVGIIVDGFRPDRWDLLGAAICIVGVFVMVAPPRTLVGHLTWV